MHLNVCSFAKNRVFFSYSFDFPLSYGVAIVAWSLVATGKYQRFAIRKRFFTICCAQFVGSIDEFKRRRKPLLPKQTYTNALRVQRFRSLNWFICLSPANGCYSFWRRYQNDTRCEFDFLINNRNATMLKEPRPWYASCFRCLHRFTSKTEFFAVNFHCDIVSCESDIFCGVWIKQKRNSFFHSRKLTN